MKIRQGIEMVNVKRIKDAIRRRSSAFLTQTFTSSERAYCRKRRMSEEHYAARYAAKKALFKALGIRPGRPADYRAIEISKLASGKPVAVLSKKFCRKHGIANSVQIELSLAHERLYAMAAVIVMEEIRSQK